MWKESLTNIENALNLIKNFSTDGKYEPPLTYEQTAEKLFMTQLQVFPPDFSNLRYYSSPCSPTKRLCTQCFKALMDAVFYCITSKDIDNCRHFVNATRTTCKSCLCYLTETCDQTTEERDQRCGQYIDKGTILSNSASTPTE